MSEIKPEIKPVSLNLSEVQTEPSPQLDGVEYVPFDHQKRDSNTAWLTGWLTGLVKDKAVTKMSMIDTAFERLETNNPIKASRRFDRDVVRDSIRHDRHLSQVEKDIINQALFCILPYPWEEAEKMVQIAARLHHSLDSYVGQTLDGYTMVDVRRPLRHALDQIREIHPLPPPPPFTVEGVGKSVVVKFLSDAYAAEKWKPFFDYLGISIFVHGKRIS